MPYPNLYENPNLYNRQQKLESTIFQRSSPWPIFGDESQIQDPQIFCCRKFWRKESEFLLSVLWLVYCVTGRRGKNMNFCYLLYIITESLVHFNAPFCKCWLCSGAEVRKSCRSQKIMHMTRWVFTSINRFPYSRERALKICIVATFSHPQDFVVRM